MLNQQWPCIEVRDRLHRNEHLLLWVLRGSASAVCGGESFEFTRGQALVIPAGLAHQLSVPPEAIVVPLIVPDLGAVTLPTHGLVLTLGAEWDDWMLHHFSAWVSPMRSPGYNREQVIATVGQAGGGASPVDPSASLTLPVTGAALDVAVGLQRDPAQALTAEQWAAHVGVSVRTLRRLFLAETGLTFAQWRAACRTGAAAELLLTGVSVAWVAGQVGFTTTTGLIRAFTRCFGQTPNRWRRHHADAATAHDNPRILLARECSSLLHTAVAGQEGGDAATAPPVPAAVATARRYRASHLLLWAYRGTVRVRVDGSDHVLGQGWAVWMPAGSEHAVHVDPGAVALPLSFATEQTPVSRAASEPFPIPTGWRDTLLKHVIANLSAIRPANYQRSAALDFVRMPAVDEAADVRIPSTASAAMVAMEIMRNPADQRSAAEWAHTAALSGAVLDRCFREEVGLPLRSWRTRVRMLAARRMVAGGMAPSVAARRVGYTHLSGFSRDFAKHNGMPPREYQREFQPAA